MVEVVLCRQADYSLYVKSGKRVCAPMMSRMNSARLDVSHEALCKMPPLCRRRSELATVLL
jgi:hypothetical protein